MLVDRYAVIGLTRNPFAGEVADEHEAALFVDRGLPEPPAAGSATLVQLVGAKGFGKTSQVQAWRRRADGPYHYVPPGSLRRRWAVPPIAALVYADEIDRMPAPLRWRWFRGLAAASATVVAGTHVDMGAVAQRAGLTVVTHHLGPLDLDLMRDILERRLSQVATEAAVPLVIGDEQLALVVRDAQGSIRTAETLCHTIVAERALLMSGDQ